ncbi:SRPBCC family protein [Novosphingobium sp. 1949]|uniref:SRPBCC family protein n=1 Tax=Novosphingobium organovorum TaxID=2930092 RepID=A0ABT0BCB4_9SPHN|nr:SRPBCC family protein [Novosphingobium organovorum]MCJ2182692.1 SRPBCC family protein [Novosphingobium organovorum]
MKRRPIKSLGGLLLAVAVVAAVPQVANAKVATVTDGGFVVRHLVTVPADVETTWDTLLKPSGWWDSAHTWSGDAANLSIDPKAGGCFCEILPNPDSPRAAPRGSVEHMRVVYIERARVLRLSGALGPLQSDAVTGTMTIQLKPAAGGKGTMVLLEYVVGGYMRRSTQAMAPAVDQMLGGQMEGLVKALGGAFAIAFPSPDVMTPPADGAGAVPDAATTPDLGTAPAGPEPTIGIEPLAAEPPKGEAVGR